MIERTGGDFQLAPATRLLTSRLRTAGSTVWAGTGQLKGILAIGELIAMANVPSLARRSRAHFSGKVRATWFRISEDRVITPIEEVEFREVLTEHESFEVVGETSQLLRQAAERATDSERLDDVWAMHRMGINQLPAMNASN